MDLLVTYARLLKSAKLAAALAFARRHRIGAPSPPVYLDVGARGGLPAAWRVAAGLAMIAPVFVEADPAEADRLAALYPSARVIPCAVGAQSGPRQLYLTKDRGRSSLLRPNRAILPPRPLDPWAIEQIITVEINTLEQLWPDHCDAKPSFAKIDVQGYESDVLRGMGSLFDELLCLQVEVALVPFYVGQPKFQDIFESLSSKGFDLVKLKPHGLEDGGLLEFDAYMVRRGSHDDPLVRFWKKMNDVGSHRRIVALGF